MLAVKDSPPRVAAASASASAAASSAAIQDRNNALSASDCKAHPSPDQHAVSDLLTPPSLQSFVASLASNSAGQEGEKLLAILFSLSPEISSIRSTDILQNLRDASKHHADWLLPVYIRNVGLSRRSLLYQ